MKYLYLICQVSIYIYKAACNGVTVLLLENKSMKPLHRLPQLASRDLSTSVQSQTSVQTYRSENHFGHSELRVLMGVLATHT